MPAPSRTVRWVARNLAVQGFALDPREARRLGVALRFSTGVSLAALIVALALRSVPLLLVLAGVSAVAGSASWHPFDLVWDHAVRHVLRAPALPPNPERRRRAWRVATVVLPAVAVLLAVGVTTAGVVLGAFQVFGFATATSFNLCIPSELVAWRQRRGRRRLRAKLEKETT